MKNLMEIKKEKDQLAMQVEQEEEYLTNTLQKKLIQVYTWIILINLERSFRESIKPIFGPCYKFPVQISTKISVNRL